MKKAIRKAILWYSSDSYERMKQESADPENFSAPFEKWREGIQARIASASDREFVKVALDVDRFLEWCALRELPANSESRRLYAEDQIDSGDGGQTDEPGP